MTGGVGRFVKIDDTVRNVVLERTLVRSAPGIGKCGEVASAYSNYRRVSKSETLRGSKQGFQTHEDLQKELEFRFSQLGHFGTTQLS